MINRFNIFFKRKLLIVAFHFLLFGVSSCDGQQPNNAKSERIISKESNGQHESFDEFLKTFFTEEDFQFSRITFPLQNLIYDIDLEGYDTTQIKKKEWTFFNIYKKKNTISKISKQGDIECVLNIQIKETGVSVDYVFVLKENKWFLEKIIDQST